MWKFYEFGKLPKDLCSENLFLLKDFNSQSSKELPALTHAAAMTLTNGKQKDPLLRGTAFRPRAAERWGPLWAWMREPVWEHRHLNTVPKPTPFSSLTVRVQRGALNGAVKNSSDSNSYRKAAARSTDCSNRTRQPTFSCSPGHTQSPCSHQPMSPGPRGAQCPTLETNKPMATRDVRLSAGWRRAGAQRGSEWVRGEGEGRGRKGQEGEGRAWRWPSKSPEPSMPLKCWHKQ